MPPWVRWTALAGYVVGAAVLAAYRYRTHGVPGDFEVFWSAGARFLHGGPLYPPADIDTSFLYPPFAGLVFQVLALLPLSVSAACAAFGNHLLFAGVVWLTWVVAGRLLPDRRLPGWALVLAIALSFRFFQSNAAWTQTNVLTFFLVLVGLEAALRERWWWASAALAIAAGIKVVPAIFLVWLLIRGPRRSVVPAVLVTVAGVVLLPLLWRGPSQGWQDLSQYVGGFLSAYVAGAVRVRFDNYNLATLVYVAFGPMADRAGTIGAWLPGGAAVASWVYRGLALATLAVWARALAVLRRRAARWNAYEIASTFLVALLLSGVTWTHHLVTLLFVFAVLLASLRRSRDATSLLLWAAALLAAGAGFGRSLGPSVYDAIRAIRVVSWFLLVGFVAMTASSLRTVPQQGQPGPASPGSRPATP